MTFNYDSLLDLDSLPTTDYNVGGNVGNTSPVPDISTATTMPPQQQQQQQQLLPIDASIFLENENISNEDLFNAFGPLDDDVVKKEPTLQKMLFDGLATPSPGLVNLIMGIDGLQHPAQETVAVVVANVPTPQIASTATSLPGLMTSRPRRSSTQHRKYAHSPSPSPPPPSAAGKRVKAEPYYGGSTSAVVGGGRPIVGTQSIPRAVPRTHKSVPSNPHDIAVLRLFPVELLRSDRDTYKAALQANQAKLSKPQLLRLRALRRKELSCVYADNARHRRIGRMEQLEDQVGNLEAENSALRQQLAQFL